MISRRKLALLLACAALAPATREAMAEPHVVLRGGDLEMALEPAKVVSVQAAEDGYGRWMTTITLTEAATEEFSELTTALVGQILEVVVDGRVFAAPKVMEPITGGVVLVSGLEEIDARRLAAYLRT